MTFLKSKFFIKKIALCLLFLHLLKPIFSQNTDTVKHILNIKGSASVTNNGFSFIPSFSLGKPAAIFNFSINGGKRFSFDPEFRFSLVDGRPWSFIFIWRYKIIDQKKFQLTAGTHYPAVPFRVLAYQTTPAVKSTLASSRVIPVEVTPNIILNKNLSVSVFYLYAKGISDDAINNTNFVNLRAVISNVKLSKILFLRVNPQLFYLQMDDKDGFYFASNFAISSPKIPFFIASTISKPLKTDIVGKKFDWNVSLAYSFGGTYSKR